MIHGITIQLVKKTETGKDPIGNPLYTTTTVEVADVLVGEPSSNEITDTLQLYGKKLAYTLAIPKGDENDWTDAEVILPAPFTGTYRTIGYPTSGIEENIPLRWNSKVKVERYG